MSIDYSRCFIIAYDCDEVVVRFVSIFVPMNLLRFSEARVGLIEAVLLKCRYGKMDNNANNSYLEAKIPSRK